MVGAFELVTAGILQQGPHPRSFWLVFLHGGAIHRIIYHFEWHRRCSFFILSGYDYQGMRVYSFYIVNRNTMLVFPSLCCFPFSNNASISREYYRGSDPCPLRFLHCDEKKKKNSMYRRPITWANNSLSTIDNKRMVWV